jgi:ribonuclease P protein component
VLGKGPDAAAASRLGVTVTRKVGSAVERNRVKRVVREAFRLDPGLLPAGVDLIVIAKDGAPTLGLAAVQGEWDGVRPLLQRRAREVLRGEGKSHPRAQKPGAPDEKRST